MHKITSEIMTEGENDAIDLGNGNSSSRFLFKFPPYMIKRSTSLKYDSDGDLDIERGEEGTLLIEHKRSTELQLVGLQVWRGALLLADYILSEPDVFKHKKILELGSGVGLTGIVAGFVAKEVTCTDIHDGGILKLIKRNFNRNKEYVKSDFYVEELNFLNLVWSEKLEERFTNADIILAADVIYDDEITDGFVSVLAKLLNSRAPKTAYVALEKRYVFTIADMDSVAPMYEEFLHCIEKRNLNWNVEYIKMTFPQYFGYKRVTQLVLMKIQSKDI